MIKGMLHFALLALACTLAPALALQKRSSSDNASQDSSIEFNANRTLSVGFVLFPGWEPLDVFGPLQILFSLSSTYKMTLALIAQDVGLVPSGVPPHAMEAGMPKFDFGHVLTPKIQATHSFADAPALDVLFVPGGMGNVALEQNNDTSVEDFIRIRFSQLEYLVSVCTGAVSLAKSGILDGRRATTNKAAWASVTTRGRNTTWVPNARWVEDGKVWTSSGVAAGLDATYALMKHMYGTQTLNEVMNVIEYPPHQDPSWDPYAVVHKVPAANSSRPLEDCVVPL